MLFILIGTAMLLVVTFAMFKSSALKHIQIEKSVVIKAAPREVFDMVKYLANFPKWSPFLAQDPEQNYEVKGEDGSVGAQYHWNGNKGSDLGYQEIVAIEDGKHIGMKCTIEKPFVAHPTFDYYFSETSAGVVVKQRFELQSGTMDAFFMWLFGAKAEMEKTNMQGLELLKKALEQ